MYEGELSKINTHIQLTYYFRSLFLYERRFIYLTVSQATLFIIMLLML